MRKKKINFLFLRLCRGRKGEKAPPALFVAEEEKEKRERNESLYTDEQALQTNQRKNRIEIPVKNDG
jgi:hypothetical protein